MNHTLLGAYWSDREGNPAPKDATFHLRSFDSKTKISSLLPQVKLPPPTSVKVIEKTYLPSKEKWAWGVEKALQNNLPKVVIARSCILQLEKEPDPFAITAALKENAKGSYIFCFQFKDFAFLGATPERLFQREGNDFHSEAMAGTRKRGNSEKEDLDLQIELLRSAKDLSEVKPVQNYLQTNLSPLCELPPHFAPFSIHKTSNVQHLYSLCRGTLRKNITDEQILNAIHPTPALCGLPKQDAFSLIQEIEPFDRGFYGGAIGWSNETTSEWVVGIRSCILKKDQAILYSGTGIVKGSTPEEEWDELNQKLKLYDNIFL